MALYDIKFHNTSILFSVVEYIFIYVQKYYIRVFSNRGAVGKEGIQFKTKFLFAPPPQPYSVAKLEP